MYEPTILDVAQMILALVIALPCVALAMVRVAHFRRQL